MDLRGRSVLVVGGAGYIGSILADQLLDAGATVRVLDQLIYDNGFAVQHLLDREGMTFVRGDFCDRDTVLRAAHEVTDVVLLASLVGDPICKKYPDLATRVNEDASFQLIDALDEVGVQRLVFASTCSNYGIHESEALATEDSALNPQSLYARNKIAVEQYLLDKCAGSAFSGTVLRLATAYGLSPRMRFDLTVSQFVLELASGNSLLVFDADTWRPYCHVRDISKAVMTVLGKPRELVHGEVFNVGDDSQQFTKRMIVDEIRKHLDSVEVDYKAGDTDPRNYRVSFAKIADKLSFTCDYTVQRYVPAVARAVRHGVFPDDVAGNTRFGNYEVHHMA
ncbi:MAG TPA: SDR family oxidoreductase [Jatrophihabitans sp.]|nr:SDR family oxidoreductase [Jatrophihabitans sp.]